MHPILPLEDGNRFSPRKILTLYEKETGDKFQNVNNPKEPPPPIHNLIKRGVTTLENSTHSLESTDVMLQEAWFLSALLLFKSILTL
jgi:hypothetical protein